MRDCLRLRVDPDTSHRVVRGRPYLHRLLGDVDVAELLELMIHRRELALDVFGAAPRVDVEKYAAVRGAAPSLHFAVDGARDDVARQEVRSSPRLGRDARRALAQPLVGFILGARGLARVELRDVAEHDALAVFVAKGSALPAHPFGDERAANARRPHHPGRVKLHELHVHELAPEGTRALARRPCTPTSSS